MKTLFYFLALSVLMIFIYPPAQAFNKDNCGRLFPKADGEHPPYYGPMYVSTMVPSTTSYFSSFGPCSMYGDSMGARVSFINNMLPSLMIEASRGQGETLNTYAELSGCPSDMNRHVAALVHQNFSKIFRSPDQQPAIIASKIDQLLRSDRDLKAACWLI